MSDELYDSLSYATFTLSASEYQCGEAGHTGSITDICLNSVDLSDWDANRKIKVNFDISFQCDTPGCPRGKEMNRYNKTRTFTDSDSCHTPVSATANYRKACSSNNNDLIVLTLTSNKSIAYKEYFPKKEATCTEPKTCVYCGMTEGEPLGHDWKAATINYPKTCVRCGKTEGEAYGIY